MRRGARHRGRASMGTRGAPAPQLDFGERVLAWCAADGGRRLAGTRDALHLLPEGRRIPWEDLQAADWDADSSVLMVSEIGEWGRLRPEHRFTIDDPGRLLELVRERVTASVLMQRHQALNGARGVRVVARRSPRGDQPVRWLYEYDSGIDPKDPAVREAARTLLAQAHEELGRDLF